jgi:hypothetical protein
MYAHVLDVSEERPALSRLEETVQKEAGGNESRLHDVTQGTLHGHRCENLRSSNVFICIISATI